jgi:hypothetical protein
MELIIHKLDKGFDIPIDLVGVINHTFLISLTHFISFEQSFQILIPGLVNLVIIIFIRETVYIKEGRFPPISIFYIFETVFSFSFF